MEAIATQKFLRMSTRKLRVVATLAKELKPAYAVEVLPLIGKRGALPLQKVIKTAIANATVKGMNPENLIFAEIQIGEGPRLKRFRAGSRGRAKPYTHDMSHIRVVVKEGIVRPALKKAEPIVNEPKVEVEKKAKRTVKEAKK